MVNGKEEVVEEVVIENRMLGGRTDGKTSSCNSLSSCTKDIFLQLFIFLHQRHLLTAIFLQLFLARIVRSHLYGYKCTPPGTRLSHQRLFVNCLYTGTQGGASLLCSPYIQMI